MPAGGTGTLNGADARVSDYRLYNSGTEYVVGGGSGIQNLQASATIAVTSNSLAVAKLKMQAAALVSVFGSAGGANMQYLAASAVVSVVANAGFVRLTFAAANPAVGVMGVCQSANLKFLSGGALFTLTTDARAVSRVRITNQDYQGIGAVIALTGDSKATRQVGMKANPDVEITASGTSILRARLQGGGGIVVTLSAAQVRQQKLQAVGTVTLLGSGNETKKVGLQVGATLQVVSIADGRRLAKMDASAIVGITSNMISGINRKAISSAAIISTTADANNAAKMNLKAQANMILQAQGFDVLRKTMAAMPAIGAAGAIVTAGRIANLMGYGELQIDVTQAGGVVKKMPSANANTSVTVDAQPTKKVKLQANAAIGMTAVNGTGTSITKSFSGVASISVTANAKAIVRVTMSAAPNIKMLANAFVITGFNPTVIDDFTMYLEWVEEDILPLESVVDQIMLLKAIQDI